MHQPEYRDPVSGQPVLPWVRLHATRSYNDMGGVAAIGTVEGRLCGAADRDRMRRLLKRGGAEGGGRSVRVAVAPTQPIAGRGQRLYAAGDDRRGAPDALPVQAADAPASLRRA